MMDLSVILAVDGDAHVIERNIFHDKELLSDPRIISEVADSAGIFMESMMEDAAGFVGVVCPKIAALKNERTMKIFCDAASQDEDTWPCTIFATESTLPIVLDNTECCRLVVVAPHKRNADFSFRKWRLVETNSYISKDGKYNSHDIMIYEPSDVIDVTETELDDELERICNEMDSSLGEPASDKDLDAITKVLDFVKEGLVVDDSYMEAFDNDYDDEIGPDEMMDRVYGYVERMLKGCAPMSLFQRALVVQNGALKRLNETDENVKRLEQGMDSFRARMADTNAICGEGVRQELETVNLKYNSVNERLDGIQTQLGNVVTENVVRNRKATVVPVAIAAVALIVGIIGILL